LGGQQAKVYSEKQASHGDDEDDARLSSVAYSRVVCWGQGRRLLLLLFVLLLLLLLLLPSLLCGTGERAHGCKPLQNVLRHELQCCAQHVNIPGWAVAHAELAVCGRVAEVPFSDVAVR
jgi:hypothetical protein